MKNKRAVVHFKEVRKKKIIKISSEVNKIQKNNIKFNTFLILKKHLRAFMKNHKLYPTQW